MKNTTIHIIASVNDIVWGAPALVMILGVGLFLSLKLDLVQLRLLPEALMQFFRQILPGKNRDSSFQSLCAALAATVGTGNLVGVAGAICIGGPGAVFWMWVCGILGMVTKYAEAVLAVRYRVKTTDGYGGGPMHIIRLALPERLHMLAWLYAGFGLAAAFGVGNVTQINAALTGIRAGAAAFGLETGRAFQLAVGLLLACFLGFCLFGGAKRILRAAEALVPLGAAAYILLCLGVLAVCRHAVPGAVLAILRGAFSPAAVTGGVLGSAFRALRVGCSRGVFTNEAGMGTAAIAHAGAEHVHPVRQGMMGIVEVFLDTMVICTLTALVILSSGVPVPYGVDAGGSLTQLAFSAVYGPAAGVFLAVVMTLFAIAAVMGWSLYGGRCAQFLFGPGAWRFFAAAQVLVTAFGSALDTPTVWSLAEAFNGLMAIPNLIMLAALAPEVRRLTKDYKNRNRPVEVPYADFYQRKPL